MTLTGWLLWPPRPAERADAEKALFEASLPAERAAYNELVREVTAPSMRESSVTTCLFCLRSFLRLTDKTE